MKKLKTLWRKGWLLYWIILLTVIFVGHKTKLAEIKDMETSQLQKQITVKAVEINGLEQHNQALKDKLERSAKIETSDAQKEISRYYIKKYFGDESDIAIKVFTCESGLNSAVINTNKDGSKDYGITQLNDKWQATRFEKMMGVPFEIGAHENSLNLKYAKWLRDKSGWSQWVCSALI